MDDDEEKTTEYSKEEEELLKETAKEMVVDQLTESVTMNTEINTSAQKTESEPDSDNSEKENQGLQSSANIEEIAIIKKQPSRIFTKTCKNIQETCKKLTLKFHSCVMCKQCEENFTLESYLNHLPTCLPIKHFKCSFCSNSLVKTGIEKRWNHIKNHLLRKNTESICDMCETNFINEYNMAVHAQYTHFM
jgi:hypothetical protein